MQTLRLPLSISSTFLSFWIARNLRCVRCLRAANARGPGSCLDRSDPAGVLLRANRRLSQLPGKPHDRFAVLSDPGRTSTPDHCGVSARPPLSQTRRLPQSSLFRGSITRLYGLLSTLEGAFSGRRPRLASGGGSGPAGRVSHPRGFDRDFLLLFGFLFPCVSSVSSVSVRFRAIPVSPGFGWRHAIKGGWREK